MDNQEEAMIQSNSDGQEHSLNQKQSFSYQQIREGAWDQDQIRRFMVFSHFNRQIMLSRLLRRTLMIFKQMALFIYSRNPTQCRSQFQKVIKKHKSINRVLKKYQQQIGQELFQELCLSFSKNPLVKYVNQTPPPKQTAGHAISRYTQTDFPSDSESSEENKLLQKQQAID